MTSTPFVDNNNDSAAAAAVETARTQQYGVFFSSFFSIDKGGKWQSGDAEKDKKKSAPTI